MKAAVFDLDGTLLNSEKKVSQRNMLALNRLIENGVPIIIATARPPRSVRKFLPELMQACVATVCYNGAMIVSRSRNLCRHFPMDSGLCAEIIDFLLKNEPQCLLSVEVKDHWYCYRQHDYSTAMATSTNPKVVDVRLMKSLSATKLLISELRSVQSFIRNFGNRATIVNTDASTLTQVTRLDVSKEAAVSIIADALGISLGQIVIFGDDANDLGLFQCCGYPVAMGNAIPELKNLARVITDTNDHDGVAIALERLMEQEDELLKTSRTLQGIQAAPDHASE